eukprot:TRINITY_DN4338_c0_g2_i3.p1 TRINITY_DN4338_c0_g2~~TRINITY_DN4338_c0_g2_i3.p1  ORF type:complete len:813 (-),score=308.61 TRINITY_DN4338_c0_g2_i3:331-2769(-)
MQKNTLMSAYTQDGMQYLLAGARANVGMKSGRYAFEIRLVELLYPQDKGHVEMKLPKQLARVGFTTKSSSLFLGEADDAVAIDSEGFLFTGKTRKKLPGNMRWGKDTVTVLLNLDAASPNAYTISLFKKGVRLTQPQALPECMKGKVLYPTVTYRNVTLEANFGPEPFCPLPFKCHMLGGAGKADVEVAAKKKAGKCEVVYPVGLPDQGVFEWVDSFLQAHPDYVELSDRSIVDWVVRSGFWRPKGNSSNDKPSMEFGVPLLDDGSVKKVLASILPTLERNIVVAEVSSNLQSATRQVALNLLKGRRQFKKVAMVIMGEPSKTHKDFVKNKILKKKQDKIDAEHKRKSQKASREKAAEAAKKARMAKIEAAKKKKEEAGKKDEETKEEAEKPDEEMKEAEAEAKEPEEPAPVAELTEEEQKQWHMTSAVPDVAAKSFSKTYAKFSLPAKEEGFDELRFDWQPEAKCAEVLKKYILDHKLTQRAEEVKPSAWFKEKSTAWTKSVAEWKKKAAEWKDPSKKKALIAKKKAALKEAAKAAEKADAPEGEAAEAKEGEKKEEKKEEKKDEKEVVLPVVNMDDLEPMTVEDITDVGSGEPLFSSFGPEDWALLNTMFELHLLAHAFKKDLDDPDRPSFPTQHLGFYYQKYFNRTFEPGTFGFKTASSLIEIIKAVLSENAETTLVKAELAEDTPVETFVKLAEDHRRDRQRRVDAGDETALLKYNKAKGGGKGSASTGAKGNGKSSTPRWGSGGGAVVGAPRTSTWDKGTDGRGSFGSGAKRPWQSTQGPIRATTTTSSSYGRSNYGSSRASPWQRR